MDLSEHRDFEAMATFGETTRLLNALSANDPSAAERLFALVYDELHALARGYFRRQHHGHTLQPTALVNEAFLRLVDQTSVEWNSRAHFLAVAAQAMRQILIDHARGRIRTKRGGGLCRVAMDEAATPIADANLELLSLDEALRKLAALDERQSRIVELRFFGGMTVEEVAHVLGVSKSTVESEWRMARAWLHRELSDGTTP
jgi:RNA polymerase sigma-70 factor (ECF subfamily)